MPERGRGTPSIRELPHLGQVDATRGIAVVVQQWVARNARSKLYFNIINLNGAIAVHTTNLRKVGGSIMLAVPPAILDLLHLRAGATVGVTVTNGQLVVDPKPRPRYTMAELLAEAEVAGVYPLQAEEREWIDAPAMGKELI